MQIRPILLLSCLFLASCSLSNKPSSSIEGTPSSNAEEIVSTQPVDSSSEETKTVTFYLNDGTDTAIKTVEEKDASYFRPFREGYCFEGWYTDPKDGESVNFNASLPEKIYAHWTDWYGLKPTERIERFVDRINELSFQTGRVIGESDTKYQSQFTDGYAYYYSDKLVATRYSDLVESIHYHPKYLRSDEELNDSEILLGETAESINAKNTRLTVQDSIIGSDFVSLYNYNEAHPTHSQTEEDYKTVTPMGEEEAENNMSIDFSSYFLGGVNTLYGYLATPSWAKTATESFDIEELYFNGYYIDGLDPTMFDENSNSISFSMSYAIMNSGNDFSLTTGYQIKASAALRDGKIVYANVATIIAQYVDDDLIEVYETQYYYEFEEAKTLPEFEGERFDPNDFKTEEELEESAN